jgi:hypothetical protein
LFAFKKLEYEKMGALWGKDKSSYSLESDEDSLYNYLMLSELWDFNNPIVFDEFVWIVPTEECKSLAERITSEKYDKDDYTWWDVKLDLGEKLVPTTTEDYPEEFSLYPSDIMEQWSRYLHINAAHALVILYSKASIGGNISPFSCVEEILNILEEVFQSKDVIEGTAIDREILIKELCEYNKLPYPIDPHSYFDYFLKLGFIQVKQDKLKTEYCLASDMPEPSKILSFPDAWEEKINKYVTTGSILFSYLSIDEIVS